MRLSGISEVLLVLMMLGIYGVGAWVVWKFYRVLSRINESLMDIGRAIERSSDPPASS